MPDQLIDSTALREWLRNERRLGIPCFEIAPDALLVARSASAAAPAPAPRPAPARPPAIASSAAAPAARPGPRPTSRPAPLPLPISLDDSGLPALCDESWPDARRRDYFTQLDVDFVRPCTRCRLHEQGRTRTVFGVGTIRPDIVFVGEGPGADEDRVGEPFVGKAGQLLTRMIAAMTLTRDQVYIANVVKCRPPENRTPEADEAAACSPYLFRQLAVLRPKVIVTLGRPATHTLLVTTTPIGQLRGKWHEFPPPALAHVGLPPCKLMPTFHPAYLLRSPNEKGKAWEDLQQVMQYLHIPIPQRRG